MSKKVIIELFLFFVFLCLLMPLSGGFVFDIGEWRSWALHINEHGITHIYESNANYPPVIMYFLYIYNLIQGTTQKIADNIYYFKIVPILFDFLPIILLIIFKKTYELKKGYYYFLLFNIAYLYNSVIWGQLDSIHSNLILTAIFLSLRYPTIAMMVFVLALNMKIQTIIFFPIFLLSFLAKAGSIKEFFKSVLAGSILQIILVVPFIIAGTFNQLSVIITSSTTIFPFASMNAFNIWHIVLKDDPRNVLDSTTSIIGLNYKQIGLCLFFTISAITLLPLIIKTIRISVSKKISKNYQELVFLTSGVIALVFFSFNTQMHERYSHPALIFLFFYGLYKKNFVLYVLVSIAYFLNMEKVLRHFNWSYHTFIFENKTIAYLFLIILLIGIINIYKNYKFKEDLIYLKNRFQKKGVIAINTNNDN